MDHVRLVGAFLKGCDVIPRKVELVLGFKQSLARMNDPEGDQKDAEFHSIKNSILNQHRYVCAGCGFRSSGAITAGQSGVPETKSGFLEVHHLDNDHGNNRPENLVPLCPFCHQVFHCGFAGHSGRAKIGFLPEISQAHLNLMTNACMAMAETQGSRVDAGRGAAGPNVARREAALESAKEFADLASRIIQLFHVGIDRMTDRYGEQARDAKVFANILSGMAQSDPDGYARRKGFLAPFRLIPSPEHFKEQARFWRHNVWEPLVDGSVRGADIGLPRKKPHEPF